MRDGPKIEIWKTPSFNSVNMSVLLCICVFPLGSYGIHVFYNPVQPDKDILHVLHQGVASIVIPTLVCAHLEAKYLNITLKELDSRLQREVFTHYTQWCRMRGNRITSCSHKFTAARFNKEKWRDVPELGSIYKASVVKSMQFWCASYLRENMSTTPGGQFRAYTMHAFAKFQRLLDLTGPFFTPEGAAEVTKYGRIALLCFQELTAQDYRRTDQRRGFKLTPKFHSLLEMLLYISSTNRNVRPLQFVVQKVLDSFGLAFW